MYPNSMYITLAGRLARSVVVFRFGWRNSNFSKGDSRRSLGGPTQPLEKDKNNTQKRTQSKSLKRFCEVASVAPSPTLFYLSQNTLSLKEKLTKLLKFQPSSVFHLPVLKKNTSISLEILCFSRIGPRMEMALKLTGLFGFLLHFFNVYFLSTLSLS